MKTFDLPIYTLDLETDPFQHGRLPHPFAVGIYGKSIGFKCFWRKAHSRTDIIMQSILYLNTLPKGLIFIHNGGRFDIFYYLEHLNEKMFILNNRIVSCTLGKHEVRDSFAIMPFALRNYKKDDIDYSLMEVEKRDANKTEIVSYLEGDCKYLHELCSRFVERFGPKLTIGSTALTEIKKLHKYTTLTEREDESIRSKYYYGGRVECFEKGIINTDVKVYDVNSMYPFVMRDYLHPIGKPTLIGKKITKDTFFVTVTGKNFGAFPVKNKFGTKFNGDVGTYSITIHEWRTAINHGLFKPYRIEEAVNFRDKCTFGEFVNSFYSEREAAKISGDTITNLFTKFILNSGYGKFAQNPENAFDFDITPADVVKGDNWVPSWIKENKYVIWKRKSAMADQLRINVSTAASITGAARSVLLGAIANSERPIYCDTDSLICRALKNVKIAETELGAWKLEKQGDMVAVAGRKMYAVFLDGKSVKMASKGVKISADEIVKVASGETVHYKHMVPSFSWDGTHTFIKRRVRMT
jgi:hypothetical protein